MTMLWCIRALCVFVTVSATAPANALLNRVWVSGRGVDSTDCGPIGNPCRSFQYAHDNAVAPGGEIDVLDPAGYGAININKPISIVNDGVGTAGVQGAPGSDAILINTSGSGVHLRGLTVEGLGSSGTGIHFLCCGHVEIVRCVVRHFDGTGGAGLLLAPTGGNGTFVVSDSIISDNWLGAEVNSSGAAGVVQGTFVRTAIRNNGSGALVASAPNNGASRAQVEFLNGVISSNTGLGIQLSASGGSSTSEALLRNMLVSQNVGAGVTASGSGTAASTVRLAQSLITANVQGVNQGNGSTVYSYKDNDIDGNQVDVAGTLTADLEQ